MTAQISNVRKEIVLFTKDNSLVLQNPIKNYPINTMRLYAVLLYFLQTVLHVSDDTLIHHQERIQTVITTSGTGRTVFSTVH